MRALIINTDMAAPVGEAKVSPQQIAARTLEGLRAGQEHILANDAARAIRAALRTDPDALAIEMHLAWTQGASPGWARRWRLAQTASAVRRKSPLRSGSLRSARLAYLVGAER
jgi:hypothetical protein